MRKVLLVSFAAAAVGVVLSADGALAQAWPARPVRLVVPFGAGGNTDVLARFIAARFGDVFKQQFIVENRPGAAGIIGAELVAHAPADGYTLLLASQPQIVIAPAMRKTSYDPAHDFVPISKIATIPFALVVRPGLPVKSLADFIDFVRRHPRQLTYAVTGFGSVNHFTMLLLLKRAGLEMTPVSYKGGPDALADLLADRVDAYFAGVSVVMTHLEAHGLRALAITSDHRFWGLPQVPTLAESGYPDLKILLWEGVVAPSGVPTDVVDRIAAEADRMARDTAFAKQLARIVIAPVGSTPKEFAASIAADLIFWRDAVRITGMGNALEKR